MREALESHPNVGQVRGEGMLCAVELVSDRDSRKSFDPNMAIGAKIVAEMVRRGVIARAMPQGDILGFAPPLCLSTEEAEKIVNVTKTAVEAVLG